MKRRATAKRELPGSPAGNAPFKNFACASTLGRDFRQPPSFGQGTLSLSDRKRLFSATCGKRCLAPALHYLLCPSPRLFPSLKVGKFKALR